MTKIRPRESFLFLLLHPFVMREQNLAAHAKDDAQSNRTEALPHTGRASHDSVYIHMYGTLAQLVWSRTLDGASLAQIINKQNVSIVPSGERKLTLKLAHSCSA